MNSKRAKKLRALVRHLQDRGAIVSQDWTNYGEIKENIKWVPGLDGEPRRAATSGSVVLDPTCGKAIYRQMKKRTDLKHHT